MCDEHADEVLAGIPVAELASVTGSTGLDAGPAPQRAVVAFAAADLHGRARRTARRKAERKAQRRARG